MQHVVPNKRPPCNVITSSNIDRCSKLLFHQLFRKIEINKSLKFSAQLKRVTTLAYLVKYRTSKLKLKSPNHKKSLK